MKKATVELKRGWNWKFTFLSENIDGRQRVVVVESLLYKTKHEEMLVASGYPYGSVSYCDCIVDAIRDAFAALHSDARDCDVLVEDAGEDGTGHERTIIWTSSDDQIVKLFVATLEKINRVVVEWR